MLFGLINKNSGPGFHRVMMPLLMMEGIDTYITNAITPQDFEDKKPSAIFYNRVISDDVLALANKHACKIVVDVDDYWLLDEHHIASSYYRENDFEALQIKHLQQAHTVTTTHARLAEKIYPYNKNVVILPNAIPRHEYFSANKTEGQNLRLFWQGSITHERDIELLRNPFKRLDKNKYTMVFAGYTKHDIWDRMVNAYTNGLRLKGCILPGLAPHEYYSNYQYADVCLTPLVSSTFNALKSNLKILEAANLALPVIASHVHPYLNMPVLYAKHQTDWCRHIHTLTNAETRTQLGLQLKQYCDKHYNYTVINQQRMACFE